MKRAIQFLFLSVLFFFISSADVLTQEQTSQQQFPLGLFLSNWGLNSDAMYERINEIGINYIVQYAPLFSYDTLKSYNLIAIKEDSPSDYISYFSRGYYTKWESEENQTNLSATGVKHDNGTEETYLGKQCWSTGLITQPINNFVYGPDYRQDKYYRLNYYNEKIFYTAKFVLGFEYPYSNPDPDLNVCKIAVVHRYRLLVNGDYMGDVIDTLDNAAIVLKVSDFPHNQFLEKSLTYNYPGNIPNQNISEHLFNGVATSDTLFDDEYPGYGIQFIVDWYGVGTLYVDYVEVFDNTIWGEYLINTQLHSGEIISFANNYSSWNFLKYWYAADEPETVDQYTPMRTVNSLLRYNTLLSRPLITEFNPGWNGERNGIRTITEFYKYLNPEKLMIDQYPFYPEVSTAFSLKFLQGNFQDAAKSDSNFWYVGQGFAQFTDPGFTNECGWAYPTPEELKSSVMLALAHGAKGILFWKFDTDLNPHPPQPNCPDDNVYFKGIAGLAADGFPLYPLGEMIKNNLGVRLNSEFGDRLLNLVYTKNYAYQRKLAEAGSENFIPYLMFNDFESSDTVYFHIGDFFYKDQIDNKHFLIANLVSTGSRPISLTITDDTGRNNIRIRNIESQFEFDTTFTGSYSLDYDMPSGEGYLFQVAPVVLYGGRLRYNETVTNGMTLLDDMIIENGATLTVTGTYNSNANITVKDGGSIKTVDGGEIIFSTGKRLIIDELATVKGTSSQKLTLNFYSPNDNAGIEVLTDGDFTLSKK